MKATPGKWLKLSRIGYFAAAALMFLFFLYLRFPGEAVTGYFQAAFAARFPQARLTLETVRPALPPGLRTDQAAVHFSGRSGALFHAEGLTIRPSGLSLLQGRMSLLAEALGYGGKLEGRIAFQRLFSLQGPFTAEVAFGEIRTEQIVWLKEALSRPLTGRLQGTLQYSGGTGESLQSGTGQLDFTMVNGSYPLRESLFGIDRVDFSRIEGKIGCRNGALHLSQLTLEGEKLRLSFRGNLLLAEQWPESRLELTGTIQLTDQGDRQLRVAIDGTVGNPRARLL